MKTLPATRRLAAGAGLVALALVGSGCWLAPNPQLWPEPMKNSVDPLPPGDAARHPAGPEEVTIVRHADPVQVRPAGMLSGYPLAFYDKRTRLNAGSSVIVSPGGRAEVLWPEGTSIVVFGRGIGWVGSPSRGEPLFDFQEVERARLMLREGDQVRLVGGALLSGASGPYLVEHNAAGALWVHNQSKGPMTVAFRDESFELSPGQAVMLPLLSAGGEPFSGDLGMQRIQGPGFSVFVRGDVDAERGDDAVRLRAGPAAVGEGLVHALGLRVRLGQGEAVSFSSLARRPEPSQDTPTEPQPPAGADPEQDPQPRSPR